MVTTVTAQEKGPLQDSKELNGGNVPGEVGQWHTKHSVH